MIEIYEIKEKVNADNELSAQQTREKLKENNTYFVNLMTSPGAGKTTLLRKTIEALKDEYRIGVMEADVDSHVDANAIAQLGVRVVQLHSGGLCHMDVDMTERGLEKLGMEGLDLIFLENIGNLVCPAEFDVGAQMKAMILSVPEGDDKPLKYPLMFSTTDALVINKYDMLPYFDFDTQRVETAATDLNPRISVFHVSSRDGSGTDELTEWLSGRINQKIKKY